jgi:glycosyltransferase involved in cell wall biosynthesis
VTPADVRGTGFLWRTGVFLCKGTNVSQRDADQIRRRLAPVIADVQRSYEGSAPPVTVVITTYNRNALLRRSLETVLAQTYKDFEVLVWDDGSSEPAEPVVAAFADDRVRYVRSEENLGACAAHWAALSAARGLFVAHLDDDDEWDPSFLEVMVSRLAEDPRSVVAFCDHWITDEHGTADEDATERSSAGYGRSRLAAGKVPSIGNTALRDRGIALSLAAVIRRAAIDLDDFPTAHRYAWDLWLGYCCARSGLAATYEPQRLARYRVHGRQLTQEWPRPYQLAESAYILRTALHDRRVQMDRASVRRDLAETHALWAVAQLRAPAGVGTAAKAIAVQGLRAAPTPLGAAALLLTLLPARVHGPLLEHGRQLRCVLQALRAHRPLRGNPS